MVANPYQPSVDSHSRDQAPFQSGNRFAFWKIGPLTGASVGLTHVTAIVVVWARHGYPDFLLRSAESAFMFAVAMSISGAIFGVPYAGVVSICARILHCSVRPGWHFWIATTASFVITYGIADLWLQRREITSPLHVLSAIVGVALLAGLLTANRRVPKDRQS